MKQLIEEQKKEWAKIQDLIAVVVETDVLDTDDVETYYRNNDKIVNRFKIDNAWMALNMSDFYAKSLKQFIDELIAREEGEFQDEHPVDCIDGVTPVETYGYEATYNQAKKETISHLKKLKEELN